MLVVAAIVVVALVLGVALAIGLVASTRDHGGTGDGARSSLGWPVALGAGVGAGALIALLALVAGLGVPGRRDDRRPLPSSEARTARTATSTTSTTSTTSRSASEPAAMPLPGEPSDRAEPARPGRAVLGPVVSLIRPPGESGEPFPPAPSVVDELRPGTVLRVRVVGFEPFTAARVMQCVVDGDRACGNALPVQLDQQGGGFFQYLVADDFAPAARAGRCRADAAPCSIVVADPGGARAELRTVFHDPLRKPSRVEITPRTALADGQRVTVRVSGFPPGTRAVATLCAAPAVVGEARCGSPAPAATLRVAADGTGRTDLVVRSSPVGREELSCRGRDGRCGVSVTVDGAFVAAPVVPVGFTGAPGARYDRGRVVVGLAFALLLTGVAAWILRRTDWSAVGESAAPEIDDAEYADLDAIVAALPPEDLDEELATGRR